MGYIVWWREREIDIEREVGRLMRTGERERERERDEECRKWRTKREIQVAHDQPEKVKCDGVTVNVKYISL